MKKGEEDEKIIWEENKKAKGLMKEQGRGEAGGAVGGTRRGRISALFKPNVAEKVNII